MAYCAAVRKLSKTEILTRNICFLIIAKLSNMNKVNIEFVRDHLQYKHSKTYIGQTWLNAIEIRVNYSTQHIKMLIPH